MLGFSPLSSTAVSSLPSQQVVSYTIAASTQTYSVYTSDTTLSRPNISLVADTTPCTLQFTQTNLAFGRVVAPNSSQFTITPISVNLLGVGKLVADTQSYTTTYNQTQLTSARILTATQQNCYIQDNQTSFFVSKQVVADIKQLTVTANPVNFAATKVVVADTTPCTLQFTQTNLAFGRVVAPQATTYVLQSPAVILNKGGVVFSIVSQSYGLTTTPLQFHRNYNLGVDESTFYTSLGNLLISGDFTRTFNYRVNYGASLKVTKRVNKFETNGYSSRFADGINRNKRVWSVSISNSSEIVKEIAHFFRENKGYKSFYWQPPSGTIGRWECSNFSTSYDDFETNTITAEFTEVFA